MKNHFKSAKWIWLDENHFPGYGATRATLFGANNPSCKQAFAHFYKDIYLDSDTTARMRISADVFYLFFLNGEFIERGPAEVGGDFGMTSTLPWRFYDEIPLKLKRGNNKIEVWVSNAPRVLADISSGRAGLIAEAESDRGELIFKTDSSWLSSLDLSREVMLKSKDTVVRDLKLQESERLNAVEVDHIDTEPSGLMPMRVRTIEEAARESVGNILRIDFGKVYPAFVKLKMHANESCELNITYRETFDGQNIRYTTLKLPAGDCEYFSAQLHSYRYIDIDGADGVTITAQAIAYHYDVDEDCYFRCDDEEINKIFHVCKRTLRSCMHKYHLDSPIHQEPLACTGDYYIESLMNYMTYGVRELTRLDIIKTARLLKERNGRMFHTSYSLIWVQWLLDYYNYSGDKAILSECEEALDILLSRFAQFETDGILDGLHDYMFIDWIMVDGFTMHHPPKNLGQCAMNAFYCNALTRAAEIKALLTRNLEAALLNQKASKLRCAFDREFLDAKRGLYHGGNSDDAPETNWLPKSNGNKYFTTQANTLAALYVLDCERGREIMERVINDDTLVPCQIYFMHFVFEALVKVGLFEKYAYKLIKLWAPLVRECDSSLKETLIDCITPDYSHAWGGTPAYQLPARIFGIEFKDGKHSLGLPMLPDGLNYAEAVIPFNGGKIRLSVERQADDSIKRTEL